MWKKDEVPEAPNPPARGAGPSPTSREPSNPPAPRATIGRSITIHGEVTGDEDLLIQGRVEGSVDLKQHSVWIGTDGVVKATITARQVIVEGKVEGNVKAEELIILRENADVTGDLTAPRAVLEDGARLRGGVDMGDRGRPEVAATGGGRGTSAAGATEGAGVSARGGSSSSGPSPKPNGGERAAPVAAASTAATSAVAGAK